MKTKKYSDLIPVPNQDITEKGFYVYKGTGRKSKKMVYIGTTIQVPKERFRWHKHNGKNLIFEVIKVCENADEMLDLEYKLIQRYRPDMNKITKRKQNLNVALTDEILKLRENNVEWCQSCLKRRVNKGYSVCYFCENE